MSAFNVCVCVLFRDRDSLCSEVESIKRTLLKQESRETLVKEQLDKATKEVSLRWSYSEAQLGFPSWIIRYPCDEALESLPTRLSWVQKCLHTSISFSPPPPHIHTHTQNDLTLAFTV